MNKGTNTINKRLILIRLENNDFYCFANCPIIHQLFFVIVTSKLTHGILKVYSWLSTVVTLNMQAPPSTLSCAALALRLFRSLPAMPITSQSSGRERAQLSQLSCGGFSNSKLRMQNTADSHEYRPSDVTADVKLVLGSFDRNIFRHHNRQLNEHKYFF